MLQKHLLFLSFGAEVSDSGSALSDAVARVSNVFCNSVSADHIALPASRFLAAAAVCVTLFFRDEKRKSSWSGCFKVALVICQQIFPILALTIFLLKFL